MRSLVILRGCPGSGKSTWIKENHLEQYTLSPDNIRTMVCAPVLTPNSTDFSISQENDTYVWSLLFELLEKRMENGDFTIIDATHSKSSDFSRYNSLCSTYRYRKYVISFTDVPMEVCKERNRTREKYKRVPDEVIEKMYSRFATQEKTSGWVEISRDKFWETFENKIYNYDEYKTIHVIGDIHGCYNPLKEYILSKTNREYQENITPEQLAWFLNEEDAYIFVGDFLDRGLQNKEVLEFICEASNKKNVLLLEGNHERNLWYYANEQDDKIKSRIFMKDTVPQIREIDPSKIRQMYRKLGQMAYIEFYGQKYLITHAGLNVVPDYLSFVSTSQFIRGVGVFRTPIDEIFTKNTRNINVIQLHGHRNIEDNIEEEIDESDEPKELPYSFSLEDRVEFGGNLKVVEINEKGNFFHSIKNNLYKEPEEETQVYKEELNQENLVERLRENSNIRENQLPGNISSFNFTSRAFLNKAWDNETVKARGLFIDTQNNKIVARGYEKFFNINERESTKLFNLKSLFENDGKVIGFTKYNGFLGILSYYHDNLQFHSKSSNQGDYANYFKDLFYKQFDEVQIAILTDYLKANDVSLTFEVIDINNDPHIIEEKNSRVVLLDIIHNELQFNKESYEKVVQLAKSIHMLDSQYKQIYIEFNSYRELTEFFEKHKDESNMEDTDIEGVVIESSKFMTKLKFNYYSFWKHMRMISEQVAKGSQVKTGALLNPTANLFYKFLKDKHTEETDLLYKIKELIGLKSVKLQDIKRANIVDDTIILKVPSYSFISRIKRFFKILIYKNKSITIFKEKSFKINQELIYKLKEIQNQKTDIISLRNEFYSRED